MNRGGILLLFSFGAGLATGLSRFGEPLGVTLVTLAVVACCWRRPLAMYGLAVLLGRGSAALAWRAEAEGCVSRMPSGSVRLTVRLTEPVLPEARLARVALPSAHCSGELTARWPGGLTLAAGTGARIEGRWLARPGQFGRPDGVLNVQRFTPSGIAASPAERLRTWLARTSRQLYGERAGTVDALIVNRRGAMPPELRDRYARAGLVHILSISGFHVGVIIAWIVLLARAVGIPGARAGLVAAGVAALYVAFLGWPAPAARAGLLAALAAVLHLRQRHVEPFPLLAGTCLLVLLLDPWAALDPGAWLSASALSGALYATQWSDRELGKSWAWRTLSGSVGATLATSPITAGLFGMVSIAGLGLNFIAIPLAALAVPGILFSLLAAAIAPALAAPLAAGSGALLGLLDQVAVWGGGWDGAAVVTPLGISGSLPWLAFLLLAAWGVAGGRTRWQAARRWSLAAAAAVWALLLTQELRRADNDSGLALHFLDVGQGDAALVRTPHGRWVLIDAGPGVEGGDAGRRVIVPFLLRHRAEGLAIALLSHPHADHLGGLPAVMDRYPAGQVLDPAELVSDPLYTDFLTDLEIQDIPWRAARAGLRFELDSVRFSVLHPDTSWTGWQEDVNEDSIVLLLEYQGFRALFSGDAGIPVEQRLARRVGRVDLLKVGHHGSRSATSQAWLDELRPTVAVVSSGRGNRYGHPHPEPLSRLSTEGISVWRTDQTGTVNVTVADGSVRVRAGRRQEIIRVGGPRQPVPGAVAGSSSFDQESLCCLRAE